MITITALSGRRRRRIDRKVKATPFVSVLVGFPNSQKGNECGHERRRLFSGRSAWRNRPLRQPRRLPRKYRSERCERCRSPGRVRIATGPIAPIAGRMDRTAGTSWSDASGWAWAGQATRCQRQAQIRALDRELRELRQVQEIPRKAPGTWPRRSPTAGMNRPHPHGHRRHHHRDVSPDGL